MFSIQLVYNPVKAGDFNMHKKSCKKGRSFGTVV
jgi:hypothetical protein